jgi:crotonobetainyl-CoA:carnitine CoA-transferase CaiB-like acyl-CoA transferase
VRAAHPPNRRHDVSRGRVFQRSRLSPLREWLRAFFDRARDLEHLSGERVGAALLMMNDADHMAQLPVADTKRMHARPAGHSRLRRNEQRSWNEAHPEPLFDGADDRIVRTELHRELQAHVPALELFLHELPGRRSRLSKNQRLLAELTECNRASGAPGMSGRDNDDDRVVTERRGDELAVVDRRRDDCDIGLATGEPIENLPGIPDVQLDTHARIPRTERGKKPWHPRSGRGVRRAEPQHPRLGIAHERERLVGLIAEREDAPGVLVQGVARGRESRTSTHALDQDDAMTALEVSQMQADGRGTHTQARRRPAHTPGPSDGRERPQLREVHPLRLAKLTTPDRLFDFSNDRRGRTLRGMTSALDGITILDLSRVLAGPSCTQMLGDLGADVIKVERPGSGDETRTWGPPFLRDASGQETPESGYYLSANRNKRSVTINFAKPEGAALVRRLLKHCDVLIENFKVGGLAEYGLSYEELKGDFPRLIYCSITGYGQAGPYAARPGYDLMAQGAGGIMSVTGEADGPPVKVGVAVNDVMSGLYAAVGILSALRHRDSTGVGQHIDIALLDVQVGWLYNVGLNYLLSGVVPKRLGTAHPNTVPYQVFPTADGHVILGANNDRQFRRLCEFAGVPHLADDPRFATNAARLAHRDALIPMVAELTRRKTTKEWVDGLEHAGLPCGPVNSLDEVFADPQVLHREMKIHMTHAHGDVDLIGSPLKLSGTPVRYRRPPPRLGEHTEEVLGAMLELRDSDFSALRGAGII